MNKTNNYFEIIVGTFVLLCAIIFFVASVENAKIKSRGATYSLLAKFENVEGISAGSDIKISGIKIGVVENQSLDLQNYRAVLKLSINKSIELSKDSSVKISSEGLLGGKFLAIEPGGEEENLKDGEEIKFTQSSVNFEDLLAKVMYNSGSNSNNSTAKDEKKS
jgi:phospholipid/cholesterol/gamma-HCH transport system substrate-binding protein